MNGYGRLVKDGVDVVGEFFSDHFERPIDEAELGSLRNFVMGWMIFRLIFRLIFVYQKLKAKKIIKNDKL